MNSEQLRLFINGAFGNEADARKVRKLLTPYLQRSLDEIRQLIELLPDESLARQREWRALLEQVEGYWSLITMRSLLSCPVSCLYLALQQRKRRR